MNCYLRGSEPGVGGLTKLMDVFDLDARNRDLTFIFDDPFSPEDKFTNIGTYRATAQINGETVSIAKLDVGGDWSSEQAYADPVGWVKKMEEGLSKDEESGKLITKTHEKAKSISKANKTPLDMPTWDFLMNKRSIGTPVAMAFKTGEISNRMGHNGTVRLTIEADEFSREQDTFRGSTHLQLELTLTNGIWSNAKCLNN